MRQPRPTTPVFPPGRWLALRSGASSARGWRSIAIDQGLEMPQSIVVLGHLAVAYSEWVIALTQHMPDFLSFPEMETHGSNRLHGAKTSVQAQQTSIAGNGGHAVPSSWARAVRVSRNIIQINGRLSVAQAYPIWPVREGFRRETLSRPPSSPPRPYPNANSTAKWRLAMPLADATL